MADVFTTIHQWLVGLLGRLGAGPVVVEGVVNLIGAVVVATFTLVLVIFTIWMERKWVGRIQDRIGPNRVGPWGIFQSIADVLKLITKEIVFPAGADRVPYVLAPIITVASVLLIWAVIPFARTAIGTNVNIGALYFVSVSSLGVMGILMAGWSSNNKYALLGAFRAVAMLVSYEVPMILTLLVPVLLTGSMRMNDIVQSQTVWYVFAVPVAALIFYIASVAEVGRSPFDLLEAESEIVAGFHIEYSGMAFAMFYLAEFLHAFTISALTATLFLGGWRGPGADQFPTLGVVYFFIKTFAVYFFNVWARGTLPRLRIDHMMSFCWKFLVPLSLIVLVVLIFVDKLGQLWLYEVPTLAELGAASWLEAIVMSLPRTAVLLVVNLLIVGFAIWWIGLVARRERTRLGLTDEAVTLPEPGFEARTASR
jgi:NADH-quinone oxidoreductase subunit H